MLLSLSLTNFVLAEKLELEFSSGFGVLTGETGAGKSLLFDALQCITGKRAETSLIREGANKAEISAVFSLPIFPHARKKITTLFEDWSTDCDELNEILIRRIIELGGRSKAYINGSQVTVSQLGQLGEVLLDIHGQHDTTLILKPSIQRDMLDEFAGANELTLSVANAFKNWQKCEGELHLAQNNLTLFEQQRELLEIRQNDLKNIKTASQWEEINRKHSRLSHLQSLRESGGKLLMLLEDDEYAIDNIFTSAIQTINTMKNIDDGLSDIYELLDSAQTESREASRALRNYLEKLEGDPDSLASIENDVRRQMETARKYKTRPEELNDLREATEIAIEQSSNSLDINALQIKAEELKKDYFIIAEKLSLKRENSAKDLAIAVSKNLPDLGMKAGKFYVHLEKSDPPIPSASGLESAEFQISGLAGNVPRAMAKVASGGELSRLSLALHIAIRSDEAKVYLFDEIDAGIGGAVAQTVGKMLSQLAKQNKEGQILGVTHLAQVACNANWHGVVEKSFSNQNNQITAKSTVRQLTNENERVAEIARMLGGEQITEATLNHAQEMLSKSLI